MVDRSARSLVLPSAAVLTVAATNAHVIALLVTVGLLKVLEPTPVGDSSADAAGFAVHSSTSGVSAARTCVGASTAVVILAVGLVVVLSLVSVGITACRYGNSRSGQVFSSKPTQYPAAPATPTTTHAKTR